jgi:hypothetical protein
MSGERMTGWDVEMLGEKEKKKREKAGTKRDKW